MEILAELEKGKAYDLDQLGEHIGVRNQEELYESELEHKSAILGCTTGTPPWKQILTIPISSEHHKLGVLGVLRRTSLDFQPNELEELRMFARLIAVTIRNEDRIIIQNALHDLEILDADIATVIQYDPDEEAYLPLETVAVFPEEVRSSMETPRSGGLADRLIQKQREIIEDVEKEIPKEQVSTFVKEQKVRAYVGLPLISNQQSLGAFFVSFISISSRIFSN